MRVTQFLNEKILEAVKTVYGLELSPAEIEVSAPKSLNWGDYSTNVAMKLSKQLQQAPGEIAKNLSYEMSQNSSAWKISEIPGEIFKKIDFQDPGFINFTLSEEFLARTALNESQQKSEIEKKLDIGQYRAKTVLFEYTDPNLFKHIHIGHLMTNTIGESLSRIYEMVGADVKRLNYQSDVGLNVAKAIWGAFHLLDQSKIQLSDMDASPLDEKVGLFADGYVLGSKSYKEGEKTKDEINQVNIMSYIVAQERLKEEENWIPVADYRKLLRESDASLSYEIVKEFYYKGRKWSLEKFEKLYNMFGTKFDHYYFESMVGEYGLKLVNDNLARGVFERDQGAVIFRGENFGLHTRVFVNSLGLPLYEAKDLGLAVLKSETYSYDLSFVITANEINEYFKVILKAMEQIRPDLAAKTIHIGHGVMRFKQGKMSSRTGEIVSAEDLINDVKESVLEQMAGAKSEDTLNEKEKSAVVEQLAVGAIKYSILKQGLGKDIIFDKAQSISITGNTGPYLQYTHARANSILEKAAEWSYDPEYVLYEGGFEERGLTLARHLSKFVAVLDLALELNSPNLICEYLFELAQHYNALYNDLPILTEANDRAKILRLQLTKQTRDLIKTGLWLLGIAAPDRV